MAHPFVFISYSHKDEREKEALLTHLRVLQQANHVTLWSDDEIEPGSNRQKEIAQAIARANLALLLITSDYLASPALMKEQLPALLSRQAETQLRIIPVIAKPCSWQQVEWLKDIEVRPKSRQPVWRQAGRYVDQELAALTEEILGLRIHNFPELPSSEELIPDCPYLGLSAFRPEQAHLFFGRKLFIQKLVQATESRSLVVVLGASGSGKSSVVFAGLVPALAKASLWKFTYFRPGDDPFFSLASALVPLLDPELSKTKQVGEARDLATRLYKGQSPLSDYLKNIHKAHPDYRLLLIADQFEEIYTLCRDITIRQRFLDVLLEGVGAVQDSFLTLVLTLRADFLGQASLYRPFADALQGTTELLGPMTRTELTEAIEKPAALQNVHFEKNLVERLLDDVGEEEGSLPLLEFALTELWQHQHQRSLTHTAYEEIGQAKGALSRHADQVYSRLSTVEQEQARRIFVQLVNPSAGTEATRRLAYYTDLESDWPLVAKLANERLVVTNESKEIGETAELVHEALIRHWQQLRVWVEQDREFLTWRLGIQADLKRWVETKQDDGALLRGAPLAIATEHLAKRSSELTQAEQKFIQASLKLQKRRAVLLAIAGVVVGILAVVAIVFGIQSYQNATRAQQEANRAEQERQRAEEETRRAESRGLTITSIDNFDKDLNLSLLLAMYSISKTHTLEAEKALRNALRHTKLELTWPGHNNPIYDVVFSPDGKYLATSGADGQIKIWDPSKGQELKTLSAHTGVVYGLAFNPEGKILATAGEDGTVRLWDLAAGRERLLVKQNEAIRDVIFSPDGKRIATVGNNKVINIWESDKDQQPILSLTNLLTQTQSIDFSPDGVYLAAAQADGTVVIYNSASGKQFLMLSGHKATINDVDFSPDGKYVITVSDDGTAILWDSISGEQQDVFSDTAPIYGVNFKHPAGKYIITSNRNGEVKLWTLGSDQPLVNFTEELHSGSVAKDNWSYRVGFSPKGARIAVGSRDGRLQVWAMYGGEVLALGGHKDRVRAVVFSPDGQRLATASWDKTGRVWDAKSGQEILVLEGHQDRLIHIGFSPDGQRLVTASADKTAKVWDASTGDMLVSLEHSTPVHDAIFSPDGKIIVSGTNPGGAINIWDAVSYKKLHSFQAHDSESSISRASFSSDGQYLATASSDGTARVWDTTTWAAIAFVLTHTEVVDGAVFSPDGKRIATAGWDNIAKVWNAISGKELFTLSGHTQPLGDIIFSPDGTLLATASDDKTVKIWDASTEQEILTLSSHLDGVNEITFSSDGQFLATANHDSVVLIYPLSTDMLMGQARTRLKRPLTPVECQRYLNQSSCPLP